MLANGCPSRKWVAVGAGCSMRHSSTCDCIISREAYAKIDGARVYHTASYAEQLGP